MNFFVSKFKNLQKGYILFFLLAVGLFSFFVAIFLRPEFLQAATQTLTCNNGETREIQIGAFVNAAGTTFDEDSDLILNADAPGSECTFVLVQEETDASINLASLDIDTGVTLSHPTSTTSTVFKIDLNVSGVVTLDGHINVTGKGYLGGHQGDNDFYSGRGEANQVGSDEGNGGSHGAIGGRIAGSLSVLDQYDSLFTPSLPGGGGSAQDPGAPEDNGGNGGGVVILSCNELTTAGASSILADGMSATTGGGGAGGTIRIDANSGTIGTIAFSAIGGNSVSGGGGSGGRIILRDYIDGGILNYFAYGGVSDSLDEGSDGSAGTVILLSDSATQYGILRLDNNGLDNAVATFLLLAVQEGDGVAEYGDAYVFDEIQLAASAKLDVVSVHDNYDDGRVDFNRKLYVSSCPVDDDDITNGEIVYNNSSATGTLALDYTCVAPQRVVEFVSSTLSISENDDTATFSVHLPGVTTEDVSVDYALSDASTATSGSDYTFATGTLHITAGNSSTSTVLTLINDSDVESDETVVVYLSNPVNAVIGTEATSTLTITDNDKISIDPTELSLREGGDEGSFSVVLSEEPSADVTLVFFTAVGEDIVDDTLTLSSLSLVFTNANWDTPQTVTVTPLNDATNRGTVEAVISFDIDSEDEDFNRAQSILLPVTIIDNDASVGHHGGGGGGGGSVIPLNSSSQGSSAYTFSIEKGAAKTTKNTVGLHFEGSNIKTLAISNSADFVGALYVPYTSDLTWTLTPGPGIKTVYVKFQTKQGNAYNVTQNIEVTAPLPALEDRPTIQSGTSGDCPLTIHTAYKSIDSSSVYLIHERKNAENKVNGCTKEHLTSPFAYFSYFSSWNEIKLADAAVLAAIPDTIGTVHVLGPRFIPYNGSVVKIENDNRVYYILHGEKHWIEDQETFDALGFSPDWVQSITPEVLLGFKEGSDLSQNSGRPDGMVVRFANAPLVAYEIHTLSNGRGSQVKNLGPLNKLDDHFYRRDRVVQIEKNEKFLLATHVGPKVKLTRFLSIGAVGADVRSVQQKLQSLGYFTYEATTGRYGYETALAVQRFQKDHGIEPKGYIGPATRDLLNAL